MSGSIAFPAVSRTPMTVSVLLAPYVKAVGAKVRRTQVQLASAHSMRVPAGTSLPLR